MFRVPHQRSNVVLVGILVVTAASVGGAGDGPVFEGLNDLAGGRVFLVVPSPSRTMALW